MLVADFLDRQNLPICRFVWKNTAVEAPLSSSSFYIINDWVDCGAYVAQGSAWILVWPPFEPRFW